MKIKEFSIKIKNLNNQYIVNWAIGLMMATNMDFGQPFLHCRGLVRSFYFLNIFCNFIGTI